MKGLGLRASYVFFWFWLGEALKADIMRARIEVCQGCHSEMYPELRDFVNEDLPLFVELVEVPEKDPELHLIDNNGDDRESFRVDLLFREEIYDLIRALGFYARDSKEDEIPEEFQTGPYIRNQAEMAVLYELIEELIQEEEEEEERRKKKTKDL